MPRFLVFSDLHIPVNRSAPAILVPDSVDAVIVAGDIAAPVSKAMKFLQVEVATQGRPVIFVAGNHEHYGETYDASMAGGRSAKDELPNVHWLENEAAVLGNVRFLGATLWTDYDLFRSPDVSMAAALRGLNDHRVVRSVDPLAREGRFSPELALAIHRDSRAWLEARLAEPFHGRTVVVTHHAPHPLSVAARFAAEPVTPAFVSDLSDLIEQHQPDLWVHGHTHASFDYVVPGTRTRVVCNPRGYGSENEAFDIGLVVEI